MIKIKRLNSFLVGFSETLKRFPITIVFLCVAVIYNAFVIHTDTLDNSYQMIMALLLGAIISVVMQLIYERQERGKKHRVILIVVAPVVAFLYYIIAIKLDISMQELSIRTSVLFFILLWIFLWVPVIRSRFSLNDSFTESFLGGVVALFYSLVLFLGIAMVLGAINMLIVRVDGSSYLQAANIVFLLYAPLHFLTRVPRYWQHTTDNLEVNTEQKETDTSSRLLENLLSYVIIPITGILTIILLLYLVLNVLGDFWKDNLLEPLLVSYSITVITIYLLSSKMENVMARAFRKIFPKILVPIVLFQTISSCLKISEVGITDGRYYVIMFGVFATISGLIFSILPVYKNGLIAPILIALSIISILWPVDAFTISRANQVGRLKAVLEKNDMLSDGRITPKETMSTEDRNTLVSAFDYLVEMEYTDRYSWLETYNETKDFSKTFGFSRYPMADKYVERYFYLTQNNMIPISGYDYMQAVRIYPGVGDTTIASFKKDGKSYSLALVDEEKTEGTALALKEGNDIILQLPIQRITERAETFGENGKDMTLEEASFLVENERGALTLIVESMYISNGGKQDAAMETSNIEGYILLELH